MMLRWGRRLAAAAGVAVAAAGAPVLLAAQVGTPEWPDGAQLRQWVSQPLTDDTVAAGLRLLVWLVWALFVAAVAVDVLRRAVRGGRRLAALPLPTPWQAAAGGAAGAAVLGSAAAPTSGLPAVAVTVPAGLPTADTGEAPVPPTQPTHTPSAAAAQGVVLPGGGWLPSDLAAAVDAAAVLAWLRRRRDYRPQPPHRDGADDPPPAVQATVTAVQAALRADPDRPYAAMPGHRPSSAPAVPRGRPVHPHALPSGVLALDGPGAADAARGLLVTAALTADAHPGLMAVTTAADLAVLLDAHPPADAVKGLQVADTVDAAVATARRRLSPSAGTAATPRILLVATAVVWRAAADRLTALLGSAPAGAVTAVVTGGWTADTTWHVADDGATGGGHELGAHRFCVVPPSSAADLLTLATHQYPVDRAATGPPEAAGPWSHDPGRPTLQVGLLGEVTVEHCGTVVPLRRSASIQVLTALAVHPDGLTSQQLTRLLWPHLPTHTVTGRLYTTISELRRTLHSTTGAPVIDRVDDRYRLRHHNLDVDLWRLRSAYRYAATAATAAARQQALRDVVDSYRGELAAGRDWPWLAAARERVRQQVLNAYTALTEAATDTGTALELLHHALRVDPLNHGVHERTAEALIALGDDQAAAELLASYERRITDARLVPTGRAGTVPAGNG